MRRLLLAIVALGPFALPGASLGVTRHVPSEYATIQAGIDAAAFGDTVLVAPGEYTEYVTRGVPQYGSVTAMGILKDGVVLASERGAATTVLRHGISGGQLAYGVVAAGLVSNAVVDGFTIVGGMPLRVGILQTSAQGGRLTIRRCDLQQFESAAVVDDEADVQVEDTRFEDCTDSVGRGAVSVLYGSCFLTRCTFVRCSAAGVIMNGSNRGERAEIRECVFEHCSNPTGWGGAIGIGQFGEALVDRCTFRNNQSVAPGGAVSLTAITGAETVSNCVFRSNHGRVYGGSLVVGSDAQVVGNTFSDTSIIDPRDGGGSAVFFRFGAAGAGNLQNNIVASTHGAAAVASLTFWTISGGCNVFWDNPDAINFNWSMVATDQVTDPRFCDAAAGDVGLLEDSPCLPGHSGACGLIGALGPGCGPDYPLTMIAQGGGTVSPPSGSYHMGAQVTIHAGRPSGYVFDEWTGQGDGSYSGPDSVATVVVNGAITETATFHYVGLLPLTVQVVGSGTVTPESGLYPPQVRINLSATPAQGYTFYRWVGQGDASYTGSDGIGFVVLYGPVTETAYFAQGGNFPLVITASEGGVAFPASGDRPAGSTVSIGVLPQGGWHFQEWQGVGYGSYSGTDSIATVTMQSPITEHAVFAPDVLSHGYEFSISASATDPAVNYAAPTGGLRPLYLWATCSERGLAAFEAGTSSTLPLAGFVPADGVLNIGQGSDLLMAVGGCPTGPNVDRLLGYWNVLDTGGEVCLGASAAHGLFGAVDCSSLPSFWPDPRVQGFSSSADAPCLVGTNACGGPVSLVLSQLKAEPGLRSVEVSWQTCAEVGHAGFQVYRSELGYDAYRRLTSEILVGRNPYRYVDTSVEGDRVYFYEVGAVDAHGAEVRYGPVAVTTPPWPPLETALCGVRPNPFRGSTQVRFALAAPGRARLTLYDVAGRLVGTIRDQEWPAGEHAVEWDGRSPTGRVAPGIYFVRFEAGSRRQTGRIVFLGGAR
ncbi:MAG: FlgD immunoglobulin-like domain containing protein [bacterium]